MYLALGIATAVHVAVSLGVFGTLTAFSGTGGTFASIDRSDDGVE